MAAFDGCQCISVTPGRNFSCFFDAVPKIIASVVAQRWIVTGSGPILTAGWLEAHPFFLARDTIGRFVSFTINNHTRACNLLTVYTLSLDNDGPSRYQLWRLRRILPESQRDYKIYEVYGHS
jgi:hypothetical protein